MIFCITSIHHHSGVYTCVMRCKLKNFECLIYSEKQIRSSDFVCFGTLRLFIVILQIEGGGTL